MSDTYDTTASDDAARRIARLAQARDVRRELVPGGEPRDDAAVLEVTDVLHRQGNVVRLLERVVDRLTGADQDDVEIAMREATKVRDALAKFHGGLDEPEVMRVGAEFRGYVMEPARVEAARREIAERQAGG